MSAMPMLTRLACPPEMPRRRGLPMSVSATWLRPRRSSIRSTADCLTAAHWPERRSAAGVAISALPH